MSYITPNCKVDEHAVCMDSIGSEYICSCSCHLPVIEEMVRVIVGDTSKGFEDNPVEKIKKLIQRGNHNGRN